MKRISNLLLLLAWTPLIGCNQGTTGGPGASDSKSTKSVLSRPDDTFNLTVPIRLTSVQQGQQAEGIIGINRARNFDSDVSLEFKKLPEGITVTPEHPTIKHGDTESKVSILVGDTTPKGEYNVEVTGHPKQGGDAVIEFRIAVTAKDSFNLSVPLLSTSIKQGASEMVSIKVNRDKTFTQDITLTLVDLPTGVTTEPSRIVNRNGESKVEFNLIAAPDASLGRFAVMLNGHPAIGDDASKEFSFVVSKDQ